MTLRYTITLHSDAGPTRAVCVDSDADPDQGIPALVADRLDELLGRWRSEEAWPCGWHLYRVSGEASTLAGHLDYGPPPDPPDPRQASLFGAQ